MTTFPPNGIDLASGRPLPTLSELAELAAAWRRGPLPSAFQTFALPAGLKSDRLDKVGWGVVFGAQVPPAVRDALAPLLTRRREQAGKLYQAVDWVPGDSARTFLARHLASTTVDPRRLPYYLLLVGSPAAIPFAVQAELGASYAVGRLDLGDDPAAWRRHAEGVVAAETGPARRPRRVGFWATRHDAATTLAHDQFAAHLADGEPGADADHLRAPAAVLGFDTARRMGAAATKAGFLDLVRDAPAVLVTASHGIGVSADRARALGTQGALLTQDWPGGPPSADHLVSAADLGPNASVHGLVALVMACFGGGTPATDNFPWPAANPAAAAGYFYGEPFVAALPRRLLSHDGGPALAALAHVDRAWAMSFAPRVPADRNGAFRSFLYRVLDGERVGEAFRSVAERQAELAMRLANLLAPAAPPTSEEEKVLTWLEWLDIRNYLLLGDPAARASI